MDKKTLFLYSLLKEYINENNIGNGDTYNKQSICNFDVLLLDAEKYVSICDDTDSEFVVSALSIVDNNQALYVQEEKLSTENSFPIEQPNDSDVYSQYESELHILLTQNHDLVNLANTVFALQKQYLWSYLHNRSGANTLSSFEFLKSRAAFAQCLATPNFDKNHPFLLFCGDISGIQEFIYNIYSRKAAKSIKGRSFYLQLLVDTITQHIIQETQTSIANVIYSSGGKFFMLLPNTLEVRETLLVLENTIAKNIYEEHKGNLYVCMDFVPFGIDTTNDNNNYYRIECSQKLLDGNTPMGMGDLWKLISEKTALKKRTKFRNVFLESESNFDRFFAGNLNEDYDGSNTAVCAVSGLPVEKTVDNLIDRDENKYKFDLDDENNIFVLPEIVQQTKIGEQLKDARYYVTSQQDAGHQPLKLGIYHRLLEENDLVNNSLPIQIINPKSSDKLSDFINERRQSVGICFYGGNEQAISTQNSQKWKTFEELAEPDENKHFNKLGILRMDVDNLNTLFTGERLDRKHQTFAGYSFLSMQLDWFFSGYLNTVRNSNEFKDHINLLYAGGDDLCAVGRWDKVIEFAQKTQEAFSNYVQNDGITISAGISLVSPKFPITKAIELAKYALDKAKDYRNEQTLSLQQINNQILDPQKNAIHLLNLSVSWEEFDFVFQLKQVFYDMLQTNKLSKGIMYKLLTFQQLKNQQLLDWHWKAAYTFAKLKDKHNAQLFGSLKIALCTGNFDYNDPTNKVSYKITGNNARERMLDLICLAVTLAEYYSR